METNKFIIPVYLNQRIVFDLVAIQRDGISTVTKLTKIEEEGISKEKNLQGTFGLSQALSSLFKIDLSGNIGDKKTDTTSTQTNTEKIHTPTSLFHVLKSVLQKDNSLKEIDTNYSPASGDIVIFQTTLNINPIINMMDSIEGLFDMMLPFLDNSKKGNKDLNMSKNEAKKMQAQMKTISDSLRTGDTLDLVSQKLTNGFECVVTIEKEYLNDPTMSDLVDGEFFVLGKVIKVIEDTGMGINLMRKSAIRSMQQQKIIEIFSNFENVDDFDLPKATTKVEGPVLQIIPIAIYA